jgi:hypothetical protein
MHSPRNHHRYSWLVYDMLKRNFGSKLLRIDEYYQWTMLAQSNAMYSQLVVSPSQYQQIYGQLAQQSQANQGLQSSGMAIAAQQQSQVTWNGTGSYTATLPETKTVSQGISSWLPSWFTKGK